MSKQEKIVCPAVRLRKRNFQEDVWCLSYDDSSVKDAEAALNFIFESGDIKKNCGFITNTGRFVDASEAYKIALDSEQVERQSSIKFRLELKLLGMKGSKHVSGGEIALLQKELDEFDLSKDKLKPEDLNL